MKITIELQDTMNFTQGDVWYITKNGVGWFTEAFVGDLTHEEQLIKIINKIKRFIK